MATATTVRPSASPAQVRAWHESNGTPLPAKGRIGFEAAKAYNAANGLKYLPGQHVETVKVTAKPEKGRTVTRTVNIAQARAAAKAAGREVGTRGRVPAAVLRAYVLGTL